MNWDKNISDFINAQKKADLYRARKNYRDGIQINFTSNDYLSLSQDPRVSNAYQQGFDLYRSGSRASMLLGGYSEIHQKTEEAFADFLDVEEAILFPCGYMANLSIISLLKKLNAHCLIDKALHASFYDGIQLYQTNYSRFVHNDLNDCAKKINAINQSAVLITEGIFSMSGQQAPLVQMAELCQGSQMKLLVDEAHSIGVLGKEGRGAVCSEALKKSMVPLRVIPLGKAFAAQGAVIAGEKQWLEALIQTGRSYAYTTGISPGLAYGLLHTLDVIRKANDRRAMLQERIDQFKKMAKDSFLDWRSSNSAIQFLRLGDPNKAVRLSDTLLENGLFCLPVRQPTVHPKDSGIRIVLNAHHSEEQIEQLFTYLYSLLS